MKLIKMVVIGMIALAQMAGCPSLSLEKLAIQIAQEEGVSAKLLIGICKHESRFNPTAYRHSDGGSPSYGLCQIKLATAQFRGFKGTEKELMEPQVNLMYAAKYIAWQMKRYKGNQAKVIRAYNRGSFDGVIDCNYSNKVKSAMSTVASL